jgi:hypothetical protein
MSYLPRAIPRAISLGLLASLALSGCKDKEVKPDPELANKLEACERDKREKDNLIAMLQDQNSKLQMHKSGGSIIVTIQGGALTVTPEQGGSLPIDERAAAAGVQEFLGIIERSRGAIQKCYEQALKKSTGLQSRKVDLMVEATFAPQGTLSAASSAPSLGETFDGCLKQVAQKWTVKGSSSTMTYRQVVQLKPS